jgi:hypothetical protein
MGIIDEAIGLPQGVLTPPPVRRKGWDLTRVPTQRVLSALLAWESCSYPVSHARFEHPADPLFKVLFEGLCLLGTRSLSMAEMNVLIQSDVKWFDRLDGAAFELRGDPRTAKGVTSLHEWHRAITGFRTVPSSALGGIQPGMGGEGGMFARLTDELDDIPDSLSTQDIVAFLVRQDFSSVQLERDPESVRRNWQRLRARWLEVDDMRSLLNELVATGWVADLRERLSLTPTLEVIKNSAAGSDERQRAIDDLIDNLRRREQQLRVVSVHGTTAEIQAVQAFEQHVRRRGLGFDVPGDRIDAVALYETYRQLLRAGRLISVDDVAAALDAAGVIHDGRVESQVDVY